MKKPEKSAAVQTAGALLCILAIVVAGIFFGLSVWNRPGVWNAPEGLYALLAVVAFYGICLGVSGFVNPLRLAIGADGALSASKFQFLVWNAAVIFSYVWIFAVRYSQKSNGTISIAPNVLYAMGFSIGTFAVAKAITVSYLNAGRISKDDGAAPAGGLVTTDDGAPDLSKMQMLIWTLIAVFVFLVKTVHSVVSGNATCDTTLTNCLPLPDIDPVLMVLMGLGQAAYLGNKLTLSDAPIVSSISAAGATVTLNGKNLSGSVMVLFGNAAQATTVSNNDAQVTVPLPAGLTKGVQLDVSVIVDGVKSANALPLTP
jgi:hypothetical protein